MAGPKGSRSSRRSRSAICGGDVLKQIPAAGVLSHGTFLQADARRNRIMDLFAPSHLLLLLLVILVIFGPSKLGDVGGALGKGIRDFKRAINEPDNKLEN
jgi:TatA/E family protein of Tat protein translocase